MGLFYSFCLQFVEKKNPKDIFPSSSFCIGQNYHQYPLAGLLCLLLQFHVYFSNPINLPAQLAFIKIAPNVGRSLLALWSLVTKRRFTLNVSPPPQKANTQPQRTTRNGKEMFLGQCHYFFFPFLN